MGLFDLFRSRRISPLESLLKEALTNPAHHAEFYRHLLSDNLVVITKNNETPKGKHVLQKGTKVHIYSYEDGRTPIFTSRERIFDKGIVKEEVSYIEAKGEDIFILTKGAKFILNPYSEHWKNLVPEEIEELLTGTIFNDRAKTISFTKETEVQLGQPAKYPHEIVDSLRKHFSTRPDVISAYLGWIFIPSSGQPAHYIFGLDVESDYMTLINDAGVIAKKYLAQHEFVDFVNVKDNSGISNYLKGTNPFYQISK
jgi:hypothetical protein